MDSHTSVQHLLILINCTVTWFSEKLFFVTEINKSRLSVLLKDFIVERRSIFSSAWNITFDWLCRLHVQLLNVSRECDHCIQLVHHSVSIFQILSLFSVQLKSNVKNKLKAISEISQTISTKFKLESVIHCLKWN